MFKSLILAATLLATPAVASEVSYQSCVGRNGATGEDMAACGNAEIKFQESRLTAAWEQAAKFTKGQGIYQGLLEDQRAWVTWKDKSCFFYMGLGRDGAYVQFPVCRVQVLRSRVEFLENISKP